jgi:hypothetical protein
MAGTNSFYYGNVTTPGGRGAGGGGGGGRARGGTPPAPCQNTPPNPEVVRAWATFEHVPRFHNNYVGLRNRFALLSEAYAYATFEDRIKATNYFMEAALDFAHRNAARLKKTIADADRARIDAAVLATTARMKRGGMVEILMGEVEPIKNPVNGADMCNRKDVVKPEQMIDMMWFEPAATETAAKAYYVPAAAAKAIELLKAHGIRMTRLRQWGSGVESFEITGNTAAAQPFEGHAIRKLEGQWRAMTPEAGPPRDMWEVPMNQPLARLAFYLLEPASDDGLVAWNALDDALKDGTTRYPILRRK